jgi:hypothetical protein
MSTDVLRSVSPERAAHPTGEMAEEGGVSGDRGDPTAGGQEYRFDLTRRAWAFRSSCVRLQCQLIHLCVTRKRIAYSHSTACTKHFPACQDSHRHPGPFRIQSFCAQVQAHAPGLTPSDHPRTSDT